jgi:crossover junction endodeoxyribonuclease RusA
MAIKFSLPFPPSVNSCFQGGSGQRRFKSRKYKDWEREAMLVSKNVEKFDEPVRISYLFFLPDRRVRDLSNYLKVTEDLIVTRGIIPDDDHNWIPEFSVKFGGYDKQNPRVEIQMHTMGAV